MKTLTVRLPEPLVADIEAESRTALWEDADPEIPIQKDAKTKYAKLK